MKKLSKKVIAFALAVVMTLTAGAVAPQGNVEVQAASGRVYVNPYSATVVTYKPGSALSRFSSVISIMGCSKAKEIKNLKSSNKYIKVAPRDGYIRVEFGKKAAKSTITCTVKGVKLKTTPIHARHLKSEKQTCFQNLIKMMYLERTRHLKNKNWTSN